MPRSLRFSKQARSDLGHNREWFRQPGAGAGASDRLIRLESAIVALVDAPYTWPAGPVRGTRLLVSQRHRVVYRMMPDTGDTLTTGDVFVVRIFGPGQLNA